MSKTPVFTADAPAPPPFLNQATIVGNILFCSGQLGVDPKTGKMVEGSVKDRTVRYFDSLSVHISFLGTTALPCMG
jgi:enamine deaminase RidA (YjgF/YER057c/UK114 family)